MMRDDFRPAAGAVAEPFVTLADMRSTHNALVGRLRGDPENGSVDESARAFLGRGVATGKVLDDPAERASAQTMLDYWATVLFRRTDSELEPTLTEFEPDRTAILEDARCPYPGVAPFTESDRANFFGRKALVAELISRLERHDTLCLTGTVGIGKTSLLRAGLLPALAEVRDIGRKPRTILPVVVPSTDPVANLSAAIASVGPVSLEQLGTLASRPERLLEVLDQVAPNGAILAVDGLDELFYLCESPHVRVAFAESLAYLASHAGRHLLLLTARAEWLPDAASLPGLSEVLKDDNVTIPPLTAPELLEAIQAPAARVGLSFQPGLEDRLALDFQNEPTALLQLALTELWRRREGTRVSSASYAEIGRGRRVAALAAERGGIDVRADDDTRKIMLAFLRPGPAEDQSRTVRIAARALAAGHVSSVACLERLRAASLLRESQSNTAGDVRLEWVHDVLKDAVPALQLWLQERRVREAEEARDFERRRADRESLLRRKATTRFWASLVLGALALLFAILTVQQLGRQELLLLALQTERAAQTDPDLSVALAARALSRDPESSEGEAAMYRALFASATRHVFPRSWKPGSEVPSLSALDVTADGRYALVGDVGGNARLWDLQGDDANRDQPLWSTRIEDASGNGVTVAIAPAGDLALAGGEAGTITVLDGRTGQPMDSGSPERLGRRVTELAFSPDGRWAASGTNDDDVWIWSRQNPSWKRLGRGRGNVSALAFSPDSRLLFSADEREGAILAWAVDGAQLVARFDPLGLEVSSLAVDREGCRLVSGTQDGRLRVFVLTQIQGLESFRSASCADESTAPAIAVVPAHQDRVQGLAFSTDGSYALSASDDRMVVLWKLRADGFERVRSFTGHRGPVIAAAFASRDSFVSASQDASLREWDARGDVELRDFVVRPDDDARLGAVAFRGGIAYAASYPPNLVQIDSWNVESGARSESFETEHLDRITPAFSRDGSRLLTATDSDLSAWNLASWPPRSEKVFEGVGPDVVALSDEQRGKGSRLAWISSKDAIPIVAELPSGNTLVQFDSLKDEIRSDTRLHFAMALSPDGRSMAIGTQSGRVLLYDVERRSPGPPLDSVHTQAVTAVAFTPDGGRLASGARDGTIVVWDVNARTYSLLREHSDDVRSLAFSPDGRLLLSGAGGSENARLLLWHVASGSLVHRFDGHEGPVASVFVSDDGLRAIAGNINGSIRVWQLPRLAGRTLGDSLREARWVREFTEEEERQYRGSAVLEFLRRGRTR